MTSGVSRTAPDPFLPQKMDPDPFHLQRIDVSSRADPCRRENNLLSRGKLDGLLDWMTSRNTCSFRLVRVRRVPFSWWRHYIVIWPLGRSLAEVIAISLALTASLWRAARVVRPTPRIVRSAPRIVRSAPRIVRSALNCPTPGFSSSRNPRSRMLRPPAKVWRILRLNFQ